MCSLTVHRAQNCGKREQKDRTKTLAEFPNHVLKDYGHIRVLSKRLSKRIKRGYGSENGFQPFLSLITLTLIQLKYNMHNDLTMQINIRENFGKISGKFRYLSNF